ncbi:MAG: RNA polymerase sigma-70 factor [Calditrichaeota bacterium]|nr:MAG: RNA polymerase sigma-70 factor [Calditrichota bacterium]
MTARIEKNHRQNMETVAYGLLDKISEGNQAAFKTLFFDWQPRIYRFIWLRVCNTEIAEDLVQETFFRLWKIRRQLPDSSNFTAFIFQIAHNLVIDWARKNKVQNRSLREMQLSEKSSHPASADTETDELETAISKCISTLPSRMQKAFILHRFENLTYKQIAKVMGISHKTVEKQISEALKRLRSELKKLDFL